MATKKKMKAPVALSSADRKNLSKILAKARAYKAYYSAGGRKRA